MNEIYQKLNEYLNDICMYLEREHFFLLSNIDSIACFNDDFLNHLKDYTFNNEMRTNRMTYKDVYLLAREIIETIDKDYLEDFDQLIESGELDFNFEDDYYDSHCISFYNKTYTKQLINVNRDFNYNDVRILVHEFIHYINGHQYFRNREFFTEFFSIYFELYVIDYLILKGIRKDEIDYFHRIKNVFEHASVFSSYEIALLSYIKFGAINDKTVSLLNEYFLNIDEESFIEECKFLYFNLNGIFEENKDFLLENSDKVGEFLSRSFIIHNYRYVLGTILAIYARKYSNFEDIVFLNNHLFEYDNIPIVEILQKVGIDLKSRKFRDNFFLAFDEYMSYLQEIDSKKL